MKAAVVYYSKFGNTHTIAQAVADVLYTGAEVVVRQLDEIFPVVTQPFDLLVMGVPTHKMNLPEPVRPLLDRLPKRLLKGVQVAAFDTSYEMNWFLNQFTAAKRLNRVLKRLGGEPISTPETFIVTGREGPLGDGEIERAGKWAKDLLREANSS